MPGITFDELKLKIATDTITNYLSGCTLRLFTNNITPNHGDAFGTYVEPVATGYAPITLNAWGAPVLGTDLFYSSANPTVNWLNSGGVSWPTVYGWFYYNPGVPVIISGSRFQAPIVLGIGQTLPMAPTFSFGSEY